MAYARHQSFYIRDKWFSKGLKAVQEDKRFFLKSNSFEKIGLGKNMLESLKYWLLAFNVIQESNIDGQKVHELTELGNLLFIHDRLLQRNDTLAILHYHVVSNLDDQSTVFEWFFSKYKETVFIKSELLGSFITWVKQNEAKNISEKSLKRDIDCMIQFYTKAPDENDPEDVIFCPFSKLNLLTIKPSGEGHEIIKKHSPEYNEIGITALYYVLFDHCKTHGIELLSVDEIINGEYLWGRVFNLSRNKSIDVLNILTNHDEFPVQYVRTNNLDYIKMPRVNPIQFLNSEYVKGR